MKNKLLEIIKDFPIRILNTEGLADYLIANGVIVLPFPIGTTYYRIVTKRGKVGNPYFTMIRKAKLNWYNVEKVLRDYGKTVCLTLSEAEEVLSRIEEVLS